jgi:hypothetical protein
MLRVIRIGENTQGVFSDVPGPPTSQWVAIREAIP